MSRIYNVITIGTATRDVFLQSRYFKEFRDEDLKKIGITEGVAECFEWGGKVEVDKLIITTGGGATNAAVTFARQGFKAASIFSIGEDRPGEGIVHDLRREGVTSFVSRDKKFGTGYSTILLADTGERTVLVYRGAANNLNLKGISREKLKCRWAYITPGDVDFNIMKQIVDILYKNGTKIAIDLSSSYLKMGRKKLAPILKQMSLVKGNREEIGLLMGMDPKNEVKLFQEFERVIGGVAIMSDGPRGVLVSDGVNVYQAGIYKEKRVASRLGAGDAFGSGFVAGLMRRERRISPATPSEVEGLALLPSDIEYAIRLGSANATSVVEHVGAKDGILTKSQFNNARWSKLKITRKKL